MTLARRTVIAAAAAPVIPARRSETASPMLARLISGKRLMRAVVHVACWVPFIISAADSWRGPWRAVGDGARMALVSWSTLTTRIPLVGQPNELPHSPHDLGPMQFWLLTIPVHIDADRGVLWGAVLLIMLAVSLAVEAGYAVLGATGGLVAGGVVIATVGWFPGFASWPYDNPNFGMMFFIAALSSGLAVLSGHRKWWPVLVVTASIAAQAYLTFAAASAGLVLIAAVVGLVDRFRAQGGYSWLTAGLIAGAACWVAPLGQEFLSPAGTGNMSLLLHGDGGQHLGVTFAMKVMASLAAPSSLWWGQNISQRHDLYQMLVSRPPAFGFVILAITAASLVMALYWLRSRALAGLAAISLLVSVTAATTFALIPVQAGAVGGVHQPFGDVPLIFDMFAAVLLAWLTVLCVTVLAALKLINDRRGRAAAAGSRAPGGRRQMLPILVRGAAALLLAMTAVLALGEREVADYPGAGSTSLEVSAALAKIEPSVSRNLPITLSVSSSRRSERYQVSSGLDWALTADGYHFNTTRSTRNHAISEIAVVIRGHRMTVRIEQKICRASAVAGSIGSSQLCAATPPPHRKTPVTGGPGWPGRSSTSPLSTALATTSLLTAGG